MFVPKSRAFTHSLRSQNEGLLWILFHHRPKPYPGFSLRSPPPPFEGVQTPSPTRGPRGPKRVPGHPQKGQGFAANFFGYFTRAFFVSQKNGIFWLVSHGRAISPTRLTALGRTPTIGSGHCWGGTYQPHVKPWLTPSDVI